jgi:hypothetical protein
VLVQESLGNEHRSFDKVLFESLFAGLGNHAQEHVTSLSKFPGFVLAECFLKHGAV